jgi:F-type H+-transporting ATPase subunit gamma
MASLKEIRQRISSVKSTRQITSAMKMVSAAKLKRAQDAIIQIRPFASRLGRILQEVNQAAGEGISSPLSEMREPGKVLLVVISSNRGLCGGFNSNIIKGIIDLIGGEFREQHANGRFDLMFIGKKGAEIFKSKGFGIWPQENTLIEKPDFARSELLAERLMDLYITGEYDRIDLIYNQFKNAATQVMTTETFLPVKPVENNGKNNRQPFFLFEPSLEHLVKVLIPEALKIQIYKAFLDSQAAEHGARMTAMHQATDNATDILRNLTLEYNKARQAAITGELIEIVSGAEALKS